VPEFDRLFKTLTAEQKEFWDEVASQRRRAAPLCRRNIWRRRRACSIRSTGCPACWPRVNHQDATIDQLLSIKQAAWLFAQHGGERR